MAPQSTVSVIIIFFNAAEFLQEAIDSVLNQTYEHWELLLVDDGSSDGSTEIANNARMRSPSRIRYLEHVEHKNLGMSASRNLGIRSAKGEYVAFLDADDYWLPERLEVDVGTLDAHPNVGMLYGTAKYWYSWTRNVADREKDFVPELRFRKGRVLEPPAGLLLLLEGKTEVPCTCSILTRRDVVQDVGGFEESFRGMYEDQAFYAKVCLSAAVLATGECLAWYRQHPKSTVATAVTSVHAYRCHCEFLKWMERYCREQDVTDASVWRAVRRQLWLYGDSPERRVFGLGDRDMRWMKKWILRMEERIVPRGM